jgi:hypothetical protein
MALKSLADRLKDGDMNPHNRQVLLFIWGIIAMAATSSCSRGPASSSHNASATNEVNLTLTNEMGDIAETQAMNIALHAALATNKWPAAVISHVHRNANGWSVSVVRNPARVGDDCSIEIDKKGNITSISSGM